MPIPFKLVVHICEKQWHGITFRPDPLAPQRLVLQNVAVGRGVGGGGRALSRNISLFLKKEER